MTEKNIISHIKGISRCWFTYFLAVLFSWLSYPIIVIALQQFANIHVLLGIYTLIVTIVFFILLYCNMHKFGNMDRKPYKWARYKAKGLLCGAIAFMVIFGFECLAIVIAEEFFIVHHPYYVIESVNSYVRLILYMPFYWLYTLLNGIPEENVVPVVKYLTALIPMVAGIGIAGLGYLMGFKNIRIIKKKEKPEKQQKTKRKLTDWLLYTEKKDSGKGR
ncbi:MAG: hypothetical protein E7385_07715 [Ruminococcaceae bacterium]|nr:hypothetical protein [Oscillospiraceae bacterium]